MKLEKNKAEKKIPPYSKSDLMYESTSMLIR